MLSRFLKEREIALLGGTPDRELHAIIEHQKELSELLTQEAHDVSSPIETEQRIRSLAEMITSASLVER